MIGLIVIFVAMAVVIHLAYGTSASVAAAPIAIEKNCPPHDWVYGADDKLVCSQCGRKPGFVETKEN